MMIIQDAHILKAETTMIGDNNSIIKDDEINDLSITKMNNETELKRTDDLFRSPNKRKQIKPNRVTNDDEVVPTVLTNGQSSPSSPQPLSSSEDNSLDPTKQQEAYCNLCERSFCNKYFLKTHFTKKHGVLNLMSPSSESNKNQLSPSSSPSISTATEQQQQPLPLIVSEDYCEICQKRFCNKYYLRKHKGECHGVYTDYIKSLQKSVNDSPNKTNIPSRPTQASLLNPFYLPTDVKSSEIISSPPPAPPLPPLPQRTTIRRCNICQQEFRNKALLRMHMNTFHSNETKKSNTNKSISAFPISPSTNLGFLQPFVDTASPLAHKLVAGQAQQASYGILHDSYFCAKMADRVVCEICNKQVCNKYFLKTHKAKVHGIINGNNSNENLDNIPPTMVPISNENELENSDNTYCSICKKDLSTKYLYLFHMQTIHNDISISTYQNLMEFMKTKIEHDDESDGNIIVENLKRKRSLSQSSTETNKRMNSLTETNGGLQPFLLESEDPKFTHTFVPCMVYLPVIKRVTKQVKINLRLKPVLADASS